jgi:hypothetical protein
VKYDAYPESVNISSFRLIWSAESKASKKQPISHNHAPLPLLFRDVQSQTKKESARSPKTSLGAAETIS